MMEKRVIDGTRVAKLRRSLSNKLSQEKLAKLVGLNHKQEISAIENNDSAEVSYDVLQKLCEVLGCSEEYLLKSFSLTCDIDKYDVVVVSRRKLKKYCEQWNCSEEDLIRKFDLTCNAEENDALIVSYEVLKKYCERFKCREEDLLRDIDGRFITRSKEDSVTENGTLKEGTPLQRPFCPVDYLSILHKRMRGLSPNKLCAISSILELLQNCEEDQVDTFVKISQAYFSVPFKAKEDTLREHIERYVRNRYIPEIQRFALERTVEEKYSFLEEIDWENKNFLNTLHQNLGNFVKYSKYSFFLALKRSQAECVKSDEINTNSHNFSESMEDGIDYLTEVIGHCLKTYMETEHLTEGIPLNRMKDFKQGLAKYLTRDAKKNLGFWEQQLKEYSERFK